MDVKKRDYAETISACTDSSLQNFAIFVNFDPVSDTIPPLASLPFCSRVLKVLKIEEVTKPLSICKH